MKVINGKYVMLKYIIIKPFFNGLNMWCFTRETFNNYASSELKNIKPQRLTIQVKYSIRNI